MSVQSPDPWRAPAVESPGESATDGLESSLSPRKTMVRGARTGAVSAARVVTPFAGLIALMGLSFMAFGLASGRWSGWHDSLPKSAGLFLFVVILGGMLGAVLALLGRLVRRVWPLSLMAWPSREGGDAAGRPRPRRWRVGWWLAWGGAVLALLVLATALGVGVYAGRTVNQRLAAAEAAADRDDPHWRLDDMRVHREEVPDEENSAPVVSEAAEMLSRFWPNEPVTRPGGRVESESTELGEAYRRMIATPDNLQLDARTADRLREGLGELPEVVRVARSIANYSRGRHEWDPWPDLLDTPLDETEHARWVARLLNADAALQAQDGDLDGAFDSCHAMFQVARSIGDEPTMISQIVRVAIDGFGRQVTLRVLGQGVASDSALARLQATVLDEAAKPLLIYALKGERAVQYELIRRVGAGVLPIEALRGVAGDEIRNGIKGLNPSLLRLSFDSQKGVSLEWTTEALAVARGPAAGHRAFWDALDDRVRKATKNPILVYGMVIPGLMMPGLHAGDQAITRMRSEMTALGLLLAAERHRIKVGRWPSSVGEIDRSILPNAPADPFTGRPFLMVHREGRLTIYSVGPDLKDGGGAYDRKNWPKSPLDDLGVSGWDLELRGQSPPPESQDAVGRPGFGADPAASRQPTVSPRPRPFVAGRGAASLAEGRGDGQSVLQGRGGTSGHALNLPGRLASRITP